MIFSLISILSALEMTSIYDGDFVSKVTEACVMFQTHHEKTYVDLKVGKKKEFFYVDFFASKPYINFDILEREFPDLCENVSSKTEKLIGFWSKFNDKVDFTSSFKNKKHYSNWTSFLQGEAKLIDDIRDKKYKIEEDFSFLAGDLLSEDKDAYFPGYDFSDIRGDEKVFSLNFTRTKDFYYCDYTINEDINIRYGDNAYSTILQNIDPIYNKTIFQDSEREGFICSGFHIPYKKLEQVVVQDFKIYLRKMQNEESLNLIAAEQKKTNSSSFTYKTIQGIPWVCTPNGKPLKRA